MSKNIVPVILVFLLIASCQQQTNPSVNGIWESIGSGWVLQVKDSAEYEMYDITSISCLPNKKGKFEELEKSLTIANDTLQLKKGVITYKFKRRNNLPELCQNLSNKNNNNPFYNFEVFAETVKAHYAFFELNNLQWDQIYKQQKNKLTEQSTDVELYQVIEETFGLLKDNHGFIEATDEVYNVLETPSEQEEKTEPDKLPEYGDFTVAQMVSEHHMEEEMTKDSWLIQWGKFADGIGYIQIKAMWLFADLDVPQQLIDDMGYVDAYVETFQKMYEGDYIEKEVAGVSKIMDTVMKDLSKMESIIIDVRFNGGGQDAVSFEILSHFILNEKLQVATQKLRHENQFTSVLPLYIKGKKDAFTKPIYVLTSQQTASAAEAFSIATMAMDNAKRIGSATSGALSTALEKTLPNGWPFAISNEIYMDTNGKSYENIGIPVNHNLNYPKDRQTFFRSVANDLDADKKSIIRAINALQQN